MNANELLRRNPRIQECYGTHIVLMKLGFAGNDIFVRQALNVVVEVRAGEEVFMIDLGRPPEGSTEFCERWKTVAEALSKDKVDDDAAREAFKACQIRRHTGALVMAMRQKGILCPSISN